MDLRFQRVLAHIKYYQHDPGGNINNIPDILINDSDWDSDT